MEKLATIEGSANFEGNDSIVLFKRLHNEKIKNQVIDLTFKSEQSRNGEIIESLETDADGKLVFDDDGEPIVKEKVSYTPKTREELEKEYDETLSEIESNTEIGFAKKQNDLHYSDKMFIGAIVPWSGKPFTDKQMSIAEAHEKGHRIREYHSSFFDDYFRDSFDFSNVPFGKTEIDMFRKIGDEEDEEKTDAEIKEMFFDYLSGPNELTERMSQIKNYFGMSSDEVFTKAHLDYARAHYIQDTDMDNGMTQFFQGITEKTEEKFLNLINSVGV
jgi:hypothetical protein